MQAKNKSVIYWKWEDETLRSDLPGKIDDLCRRMDVGSVFIGLHWIRHRFTDREVQDALTLCCEEFHRRGVRVISEACPRNEAASFFDDHPGETAYLTTATEIPLDEEGRGEAAVGTPTVPHYWRTAEHTGPAMLRAFLVDKTGERRYAAGSAREADGCVTILPEGETTRVRFDGGAGAANRWAVVFVGIPQPIPDLASDAFGGFYTGLVETVKRAGADGVMSDEWGYDVILNMEDQGGRKELYMEHLTYSENFARRYAQLCGRTLEDDLLRLFYVEDGRRDLSIRCVNAYHGTFRDIMRRNDETMYGICKEILGPDAFYGVHPTWWGNNYLQNFEGFKNAFYWWEAKRDIAQVDEIVIMPICTALAHKWGGDTWYNMWYSMGTRDIKTYYRDTWNNVRFGGRTHYLGYECPNESVVLELKPAGLLESIEEMDAEVRLLDGIQNAMPDCRVLVLFGMQNVLNWHYDDRIGPPWYPRHKVLTAVLQCADVLFRRTLCDLVPTTEIENGSLTVDGGRARYGTQEYDAVVLLGADSLSPVCFPFLQRLDGNRLIVAGPAEEFEDGRPLTPECQSVLNRGVRLPEVDCPERIGQILADWGIAQNRWENGCVLADGSLIFTAEGEKPTGNPLSVHARHGDLTVDFEGEDFLFLHHRDGGYTPVCPGGVCRLNGKTV